MGKKVGKKGEKELVPGTDLAPPKFILFGVLPFIGISLLPPDLNPIPGLISRDIRVKIFFAIFACSLCNVVFRTLRAFFNKTLRISQDLRYHDFADKRSLPFGLALCGCGCRNVPNAADVLSNIPFFLSGIAGVAVVAGVELTATGLVKFVLSVVFGDVVSGDAAAIVNTSNAAATDGEKIAYMVFFIGIALVGFGSAYYHWRPNNGTLVWDRLPMTIGFLASYCALIEERIGAGLGTSMLPYCLALGIGSVFYWSWVDDLTLYAWVQFFPLLTIPVISSLFPAAYSHSSLVFLCLFLYLVAKVLESKDKEVFKATGGTVSGHTLKHLVSSLGPVALVAMLMWREKI